MSRTSATLEVLGALAFQYALSRLLAKEAVDAEDRETRELCPPVQTGPRLTSVASTAT